MSKTILAATLVVAGVLGLGAWFMGTGAPSGPSLGHVVIHKSATCGCCGVWSAYLKREGYDTEIHNISDGDLAAKKHELGVPQELWSCHTSEIGGYVVEGHIPEEAIAKLLEEKPDIKGIGMAGMPSGSPGMPGPKQGPFVIYEIARDGSQGDVFMTL